MATELKEMLEQMDVCASRLESLLADEQEAARRFDGDALVEVMKARVEAYAELAELEAALKALMRSSGVPEEMTLEAFIDLNADAETHQLQSLRRELYDHLMKVERDSDENRIRLRAAADVTSFVLQKVGIIEEQQTYSREQAR